MKTDIRTYKLPRDLKILTFEDRDVLPEFDPALTVIDFGANTTYKFRYFRPYRWCYLDRLSLDATITSNRKRQEVNLLSLCPERVQISRKLISRALTGSINGRALTWISVAFDWIDKQGRGGDLFTLESAKELYRDFTDQLKHRMQLSNVGGKRADTTGNYNASRNQLGMAFICSAATGLEKSTVRNWAYRIPQRERGTSRAAPTPRSTENEHVVAHAMHTQFFTAFSDAILNNTPPPVVIHLSDFGFEDVIFYSQDRYSANGWARSKKGLRTDWIPYFYGREGFFQGKPKSFNELLAANGIEPIGGHDSSSYKSRQRYAQAFSEASLQYMANIATRHFGYILLAEAGANASTLATIDVSQTQLDKVLGATRLLAVKGRAGYERQDQFVDRRFTQTRWKRYLQLREWMVRHLRKKRLETPKNGLFLLAGRSKREPYYLLNAASMRELSLWPNNGPALATREARKHKTVEILEGSGGNVALAASMQAASPKTIERHYAYKNVIEAAKQMSDYFDLQAKSAALRHAGVKPVRIIEEGADTSTGRCGAPEIEGPQLIEGYETAGIEPRCGAPLTCLFCIHFGIHAIDVDLVRLLTIKRWVEVQTQLYSSNLDEGFTKYSPYIDRIDQVFEDLPKSSEEISELVRRAKAHFAEGRRDPYWAAKINALLDMEAV